MIDSEIIFKIESQKVGRAIAMRLWLLPIILTLALTALVSRSFYLQIFRGSQFRASAEGNRVTGLPLPAPRGIFYDMSGKTLTENIASTDVVLDPTLLPTEEHEAYLIDRLPQLLSNVNPTEVQAVVEKARQTQRLVVLKKAVSHEEVLNLEAVLADVPGVRLTSSLVRKYLFGEALAHVIGYTGPVTGEELEANPDLLPTDTTGKTGLEKQYEKELHGVPGAHYVEVNASGRPQQDLGQKEPQAGANIQLTLDAELQEYIVQLFQEAPSPAVGAVVAIDPRDGAVRALVSFPTYDPNLFSQPGRGKEVTAVAQADSQPLFNRVTDGQYPPGSTIKPFLAVAGLQEGLIDEQTTVLSTGGLHVGIWNFPDWKAGGHGVTDVKKAIAESVNTFFYILTGGNDTHTGLGVASATRYLQRFGWGTETKIDLPSAGTGFLPSPAWKERTKHEAWYIGDTYHLSIGQGDVLVTPLQLADATAMIANGSYVVQPHLNTSLTASPERLTFHSDVLRVVREGLRQTITDGSGRRLASFAIALAGKTGTAQAGGDTPTHAWFTSFGPYESPQLVVTVLLEHAGEGDDAAVPFAEKIWQWWYDNRYQG